MASRFLLKRARACLLSLPSSKRFVPSSPLFPTSDLDFQTSYPPPPHLSVPSSSSAGGLSSRTFCSRPLSTGDVEGPTAIDYHSLLPEGEYHRLADETIHDLQDKLEEYGDGIQVDGFDIDYGNEVLTLKLGRVGTYVLNKQTPNRQIWLSSPVSGPSRFDWDKNCRAWVYRRTKAKLQQLLETEIGQLCGTPINLS